VTLRRLEIQFHRGSGPPEWHRRVEEGDPKLVEDADLTGQGVKPSSSRWSGGNVRVQQWRRGPPGLALEHIKRNRHGIAVMYRRGSATPDKSEFRSPPSFRIQAMNLPRAAAVDVILEQASRAPHLEFDLRSCNILLDNLMRNFISLLPEGHVILDQWSQSSQDHKDWSANGVVSGEVGSWLAYFGLQPVVLDIVSTDAMSQARFESWMDLYTDEIAEIQFEGRLVSFEDRVRLCFEVKTRISVHILRVIERLGHRDPLRLDFVGELSVVPSETFIVYDPSHRHTLQLQLSFNIRPIPLVPGRRRILRSSLTLHQTRIYRNRSELLDTFNYTFQETQIQIHSEATTVELGCLLNIGNYGSILTIQIKNLSYLELQKVLDVFCEELQFFKNIDTSIVVVTSGGINLELTISDMHLSSTNFRIKMQDVMLDTTLLPIERRLKGKVLDKDAKIRRLLQGQNYPPIIDQSLSSRSTVDVDPEGYSLEVKYPQLKFNDHVMIVDVDLIYKQSRSVGASVSISGFIMVNGVGDPYFVKLRNDKWILQGSVEDLAFESFLL